MKKLYVDPKTCIGAGNCVALCPKTFVLNGSTASVVDQNAHSEKEIQDAIAACPTQSIKWIEEL